MNLITRLRMLRMLRRNDEGQDLLEYALLVALIALVAVGAITTTGEGVSTMFGNISTELSGAVARKTGSQRDGDGTRQRSVLLLLSLRRWVFTFAIGPEVENRHMTALILDSSAPFGIATKARIFSSTRCSSP